MNVFLSFWKHFGEGVGAEMEEKSIQKRNEKWNDENYENCILALTKIKFRAQK